MFLKGRAGDLVVGLRREMLACSERLEFERAAALRDRIEALERSMEAQRVSVGVGGDRDVVGYVEERGRAGVSVLFFRGGELVESLNWVLPVFGMGSAKALSQFLGQFYGEGRLVPGEVLLPGEAEDREIIEEWLGDLRDGRVRVAVPRRGEKLRLVEMANRNAREVLARRLSGGRDAESLLADLARRLRLDGPPARIECYDIATLQGSMSAGAGVVFVDGEPSKGDYRLYKIRGVEGQDDFAMMREVLERRFRRAIQKDEELPDLVVVDGGKGQLGVAVEVLAEMGVSGVGVAALAKEREAGAGRAAPGSERVPERLFLPGRKNPVVFPPHAPSFYLLQYLRDEAHRFVNAYHGKLRRKAHLRSSLEDIPGVGTRRAKALLRHFGSLARIREASAEELEAAPTVSKTAARDIYSYYHSSE